MGGIETSRDSGAIQDTTRALLVEIIINCSGGCNMPREQC